MANPRNNKEAWGTRVGVIMAVTGSAVGLGNFLRFPGKAAQYEGGVFMIPYFVALLLLGLPIAWAEWSMGRLGGARGYNSTPGIFRAIWRNKASPYLGALGLLIPVGIYIYYTCIEAWCLGYAWKFAIGELALGSGKGAYAAFFKQFIGMDSDGSVFNVTGKGLTGSYLIFLLVCAVTNFALIYRGINKGIEWFCNLAMPALVVCALIVLVRVLTLGTPDPLKPDQNVINGLGYMWNPGTEGKSLWQSLANAQMWLEAAGQIFFTLSVGFGVITCYASYMKPNDDVALSSLTAMAGNEFCEVALGGLITIPAAFVFLGTTGVNASVMPPDGGTFNLGFMTLPLVFESMPAGRFFGAVFFFLLFLAAITSSISMLQPAIALLEEGLGLGRHASVTVLGFVTALGTAFVAYFSHGLTALDTIDFWVGSVCIYVLATIQVILFAWVLGVEKGYAEVQRGAEIKVPRLLMFVLKYVSPAYLLIVLGCWGYQCSGGYLKAIRENQVVAMTIGLVVILLVFFLMLVRLSVQRWDKIEASEQEVSP
jgi:SNF family Na+-dependent transporter